MKRNTTILYFSNESSVLLMKHLYKEKFESERGHEVFT